MNDATVTKLAHYQEPDRLSPSTKAHQLPNQTLMEITGQDPLLLWKNRTVQLNIQINRKNIILKNIKLWVKNTCATYRPYTGLVHWRSTLSPQTH